jgi:hypothetical protein
MFAGDGVECLLGCFRDLDRGLEMALRAGEQLVILTLCSIRLRRCEAANLKGSVTVAQVVEALR